MEWVWSETQVVAYCSANNINVLGTQKLIESVNNKLVLDFFIKKSNRPIIQMLNMLLQITYERMKSLTCHVGFFVKYFVIIKSVYRYTDVSGFLRY